MGMVVFIGAGPGAADLITLRGARALGRADVVLFDALTDPALREFAPHARWIDVGKRGFCDSTGQTSINALLVRHASEQAVVARLKGGDPSIFGRLEEELEALAEAGIPCEVIPGVTAAIAAAAATKRPLTRRGSGRSVSLSTAMTAVASPRDDGSLPKAPAGQLRATRTADTEVFYMAGKQLGALSRRLIEAGWPADAPCSVVSRAGWPDQVHSDHTVAQLAAASLMHAGRPAVVTVGAGARPLAGPSAKTSATSPAIQTARGAATDRLDPAQPRHTSAVPRKP
jgi:uroporphyrin-III C-methyltransferase